MTADNVLIVDDNVWIRRLLVTILRRHGYTSREAHDGIEAIEHLNGEESYDGIILDLMMPRADGFEVIAHLRSNHPEMLARTIVLTADSSRWSSDDLEDVARVVRKPFDVNELVHLLEEIFRQKSS
jgi:CheY-like chemotaxis protein